MGLEMHDCTRQGLDWYERAPVRLTAKRVMNCTPDQLFASFADPDSWPKWVPPIQHVEWTSEVGPGATRTVSMVGGMVGEEEFIAWDHGKEMAFIFLRANVPVDSFGEHYRITDLGDGRCELDWQMCMAPSGPSKHSMKLFQPMMQRMGPWLLGRLDRLVQSEDVG